MKKIRILGFVFMMILGGCSSSPTKEYIRDTSAGEIKESTLEEVYTKFEQKEDFVLLMTFSYCSHCHDLKELLVPYLQNHHVVIYELIMDKLTPITSDYDVAKEKLNQYLKDYEGTPSLYYIEGGKKKDEIIGFDGKVDISTNTELYDAFVQKHQLDAQ